MGTASLKSTEQISAAGNGDLLTEAQIPLIVEDVLASTQFVDIHTHLFAPAFGNSVCGASTNF